MYMYIFHVFDSGAGMGEKSSIRSEMHSTVKCYIILTFGLRIFSFEKWPDRQSIYSRIGLTTSKRE